MDDALYGMYHESSSSSTGVKGEAKYCVATLCGVHGPRNCLGMTPRVSHDVWGGF